jgi:hypothetical protein
VQVGLNHDTEDLLAASSKLISNVLGDQNLILVLLCVEEHV